MALAALAAAESLLAAASRTRFESRRIGVDADSEDVVSAVTLVRAVSIDCEQSRPVNGD